MLFSMNRYKIEQEQVNIAFLNKKIEEILNKFNILDMN